MPLTWQHPVDARGDYLPLDDRRRFTEETIAEVLEADPTLTREALERSYTPDFSAVPPEQLGIQAYEITTEGTPISPVFPDTPRGRYELVAYCARNASIFADHAAGPDDWCALLFGPTARVDQRRGVIEGAVIAADPVPCLETDRT